MTFTTSKKSEQIWEEARTLAEFHAEDLVKFGVHISTARYYVNRWEQLGRIRLVRRDARNRRYFCNVEHPVNPLEPVDGPATPEGNMWRAMRLLPQFSPTDLAAHLEFIIVGALIIVFLIAEPHGLAQLWRVAKEKLRLWPFPH